MIVIGITGTLGAGKGTIVDYLTKHHGFSHYSVRGYLTKKLNALGRAVNRDTMVALANELREKNSPSFIVEELLREAKASGNNCIIESIRTVGEVNALRAAGGFVLFAVDANQKLRYERVVLRGSETDKIDFETFAANEAREMSSTDPNKQNLSACMAMADHRFVNDDDFDALYHQIDQVLDQLAI
ncbi:MAG: AAA family ATPase [Chitinophagales bacterium]|nr:AAA family ATPase [Chitinophagales bacterium]